MASSDPLIRQLEAVHLAFHAGAIDRLYPSLGEKEHKRAVTREQTRDSAYLSNMRERIKTGTAAIRQDRGLSPEQRDLRVAQLAGLEVRYLRQHVKAASWRLQSEADISRLKKQGEDGAYWKLNPRYEHCETCLRMGERWWPMSVLDRINPAVTHPGCACSLLSKAEAERAGHTVVGGRHTPSVAQLDLNETARELALQYISEGDAERQNGHTPAPAAAPSVTPEPEQAQEQTPVPVEASGPDDKAERNDRICEMWAQNGMSQSAIAREVELSQPRVRAILIARYGEEELKKRGKAGTRHDLRSGARVAQSSRSPQSLAA